MGITFHEARARVGGHTERTGWENGTHYSVTPMPAGADDVRTLVDKATGEVTEEPVDLEGDFGGWARVEDDD